MTNHYENIQRFIARALAHGAESEEAEQRIIEEATNLYVERVVENAIKSKKK